MRILQRGIVALFLLTLLAFGGLKYYLYTSIDRIPPVITCDSDVVEVRVGAGEEALLAGVTARDNADGDVTGSVMIKGVSQLITADTAKVTYIAFDSSNNMATASRTVRYTNYEKPRFVLTQPMVFLVGSQVRLLDRLTASDVIDGDISENIGVTTQNVNAYTPGVYNVTVQVTNSLGDVESLPLKVTVASGSQYLLDVRLSEYITYLKVGDRFDPAAYILTPDPQAVEVASDVDTGLPGVYEVSYTYQTDTVYQTVVVR